MSDNAPVEMSIDVLEERIPEEQRGRGKAPSNERWYCQLYAHRELPCAQVGEEKKPVNEAGIRHYSTDYDTIKSRYAQQVEAKPKFSKGAALYVLETSSEGKSLVGADVFHCVDVNHTKNQCYLRLWSLDELKNFGDEHMWEIDQDAVKEATKLKPEYTMTTAQVTPKPEHTVVEGQDINRVGGSPEGELKYAKEVAEALTPEVQAAVARVEEMAEASGFNQQAFLRSQMRDFKGVGPDQYETVAVRGQLIGLGSNGKLIVQLPSGVDYFDHEQILGVVEEFVPGEPLQKNTIITMENGSKVWRFMRNGWVDVTSRNTDPIPWRKLWKMYESKLQFWRNHDA